MTFKTGDAVVEKGKHVRMLVQEEAVNGKVECAWLSKDPDGIHRINREEFPEDTVELTEQHFFKAGDVVVEQGKETRMTVHNQYGPTVSCAWFPDDGSNILQLGCFEESDLLLVDRKS